MIARQIKRIDYKGRIQIPKQVLDMSGIDAGDDVIFDVTKTGSIVLRKVETPKERVTKEYEKNGMRNFEIGVEK